MRGYRRELVTPSATKTPEARSGDHLASQSQAQLLWVLRQASSLAASLLGAQSLADVRRLSVSAGAVLGRGPCVLLAYDPSVSHLRVEESEGLSRATAAGFQFEVTESLVREVFAQAARSENPGMLSAAVRSSLGFVRPVIYPLGTPARLRGLWVADAPADDGFVALSPEILRQFGAVVSGALMAAESRQSAERIGVLDPVTGLYDRKSAETYLRRELARARRYREPLSLVLIDLDRFGDFNERRGYQNGDRVLKEIARLLIGFPSTSRDLTGMALCFRESDLAARFGADSFAVLLPATPRSGARQAAERFLAGLRQHRVQLEADSVAVTATAAVATFPDDVDSVDQLTMLADRLVADAARAGGDRLALAPPQVLGTARPG